MTKEEEIISAIILKLQDITTANAYLTNIGNNVNDFNGNTIPTGTESYLEVRDTQVDFIKIGEDDSLELRHNQIMTLEIFVQFEKKDISYARKAAADIYKCIGTNKWYFWDTYQISFKPLRHIKDINKEDRTLTGLKVFLLIEFNTPQWGVEEAL